MIAIGPPLIPVLPIGLWSRRAHYFRIDFMVELSEPGVADVREARVQAASETREATAIRTFRRGASSWRRVQGAIPLEPGFTALSWFFEVEHTASEATVTFPAIQMGGRVLRAPPVVIHLVEGRWKYTPLLYED